IPSKMTSYSNCWDDAHKGINKPISNNNLIFQIFRNECNKSFWEFSVSDSEHRYFSFAEVNRILIGYL
ncbi:MAG: hypothetical protein PHV35_03225, partial [Mariniphaga sp.]|nr:hypothetical protein [Mariniphaga sp.]